MAMQDIDVVVRVAGATLLLWAAFGPGAARTAARRWFAPLALCLAGFLAGNTPEPELRLSGAVGRAGVVLAGYAAIFLWWWCLAVFDRGFRPRGAVLGLGVLWIAIASADRGLFGPALDDRGLSWGLIALGYVMLGHLAVRLIRDRRGDLIDRRRRARAWVVGVLAAQLLIDMTVDVALGFDWRPQGFTIAQNAALLAFIAWLLGLDLTRGPAPAPAIIAPGAGSAPVDQAALPDRVLTRRLERLMQVERVHLDPTLTFDGFVRAMGASERSVRRLINHELGHDHFRSFLNTHRVAEARRRLSDPAHRDDKLIAIALDSGFASLSSFNRVFREVEGRPPSAFRAAPPGSGRRDAGF